MTPSADRAGTRLATRLSFLATGFAMACWAPLVPFAKARTGVDDGQLGLLLLCLGIGSIMAMPTTGILSARLGSKPMILSGGISVLAGGSFIAGASAADPSLANIAGYAVLGGIFFLVSALRLGRAAKKH